MLPLDLWTEIIRFAIQHRGLISTGLDGLPPQADRGEVFHSDLLRFRGALSQVCYFFRCAVAAISAEEVVVTRRRDLEWIVVHFECSVPGNSTNEQTKNLIQSLGGPPVSAGSHLGLLTKEIDLQIVGTYNPSLIPILLEHTPNLLAFVNQVGGVQSSTLPPSGRIPRDTLSGLLKHSKSLQCLRLESHNEAPTLRDICDMPINLPGLVTLQLTHLHGFNIRTTELMALRLTFPFLTTLSIGVTLQVGRTSKTPTGGSPAWELVLGALSCHENQLPRLERIEMSFLPFSSAGERFFGVHGPKIRRLLVPTFADPKNNLTNILSLCSQLETLILYWNHLQAVEFPAFHPSLRRIWLTPATNWVHYPPVMGLHGGVPASINDLLQHLHKFHALFPHLRELWIRDDGIWEGDLDTLRSWWSGSWKGGNIEILDRDRRPFV